MLFKMMPAQVAPEERMLSTVSRVWLRAPRRLGTTTTTGSARSQARSLTK